MRTPKELFVCDEELAAYWNGVAKGPQFPTVLTYARAEISRKQVTPEMLKGVEMFEQILLTIGEREEDESAFPSPGLRHDLDPVRSTMKHDQTKQPVNDE